MSEAGSQLKMFPVSWEELQRHCRALAWRLLERGPFEGIVAVTRGGLVPAAIVARELDLRLIDTICCSTYDDVKRRDTVKLLKSANAASDSKGQGWLIVDDLVDTGVTARQVREILPRAHFATIYAKPAGRPMVDTFITEVSQDTWILFPWDQEPARSRPIVELGSRPGPA